MTNASDDHVKLPSSGALPPPIQSGVTIVSTPPAPSLPAPSGPPAVDPLLAEVTASIRRLVDHLVDHVPGVTGALVSSADGFVLASRLPDAPGIDPSAVAAMSAATLALSNRLVQLTGDADADVSIQRASTGQVLVFRVAHVAALTVLATPTADVDQLQLVGREISHGLQRLFRGTADV